MLPQQRLQMELDETIQNSAANVMQTEVHYDGTHLGSAHCAAFALARNDTNSPAHGVAQDAHMFRKVWDLAASCTGLGVAAGYKAKVIVPPERLISSWIGGSVLCSLSSWESNESGKVDRALYDELGTACVERMHVRIT